MDNEKNTHAEDWTDPRLTSPAVGEEITADDHAMDTAGLIDPTAAPKQEASDLDAFDQLIEHGEILEDTAAAPAVEPVVLPGIDDRKSDFTLDMFDALMPEDSTKEPADAEAEKTETDPEPETADDGQDEEEDVPAPAVSVDFEDAPQRSELDAAFGENEGFQEIFDASNTPKAPAEAPKKDRPARKGRPKRKKGDGLLGIPHLLTTAIWLLLILAIGVSLGRFIWLCAADVLAFGRESQVVIIEIEKTDDIDDIADKLHRSGLIKYPGLFKLFAELTDADEDIVFGRVELNTLYDYNALVKQMSPNSSSRQTVDIMIPEGYNCRQIFELLEEKKVCTIEAMEDACMNAELGDYWFLEGLERDDKYCLEGYLFPDTYEFYTGDKPERVLKKMLNNFDRRFTNDLRESLTLLNQQLTTMMSKNGYDEAFINDNLMTIHDVIIVASLIEKETASTLESHTIASVIYNRLTNRKEYPYLNIDATVLYALGVHKEQLTAEDLQIDSPYNTYVTRGMPAGPISNPGLASIKAALTPDGTNFYYYVYDPDQGLHQFSTNQEEHNQKVEAIRAAQAAKEAAEATEPVIPETTEAPQ